MSALEQENALEDTSPLTVGEYNAGFFTDGDDQDLNEITDTPALTEGVIPPPYADIRGPEPRSGPPPVRLSEEVIVIINGEPVTREELYARTYYSSASVPERRKSS